MIGRSFLCFTIAAAIAMGCCAVAAAADSKALTSGDLIYPGAAVKVEIDVNGEAAVQLVGGLLDAVAEVSVAQAAAIKQVSAGPEGKRSGGPPVAAIVPLIGPAKDVIKDIHRVTVLVTRLEGAADPDAILSHYRRLMTGRGWTPMATVRAERGERVLVLVAPGGKGVFAMVHPKPEELVVGLVTTGRPVGDMLGAIVQAGGGHLPQLLMARSQPHQAHEHTASEVSCESTETTSAPPQAE